MGRWITLITVPYTSVKMLRRTKGPAWYDKLKTVWQNELKIGDIVRIATKEGRYYKLKIVEITSEFLTGNKLPRRSGVISQAQILFNQIAKIEKRKPTLGGA
ncbi:MAG: hypothetical protein E2O79_02720 [Caldithrix sp.]|nr:MAG: hypothetical protein E2O79_02720 [Caldithrix sp.]